MIIYYIVQTLKKVKNRIFDTTKKTYLSKFF